MTNKIYHQDIEELSKNNLKTINNIHLNEDLKLANQLLAQAYLFLNIYKRDCWDFGKNGITFECKWCIGCNGCKSVDGYCSKYCMHADDCDLVKFVKDELEKINEKTNIQNTI